MSFQKILPGCERGDHSAWRTLVANCTPVVSSLFAVYLPQFDAETRRELWQEVIQGLAAEDGARLRELDHQGERECLVDLKGILLDHVATQLPAGQNNAGTPAPTLESLPSLLHGLPLAQQEIAFLKLAGYSDSTLEKMLLAPLSLIQKALAPLQADHAAILGRDRDVCPWPAAWLAVGRAARSARGSDCPARRVFVRILDGQISWYDKTPAEDQLARCLHCLEVWTSIREVSYLRHEAKPVPPHEVDALLSFLPSDAAGQKSNSWLGRLFGR